MPIYTYRREDGTEFEVTQRMNDDKLEECPETGQSCKLVITGGRETVFKGSKWPRKQRKKKEKIKKNPYRTTLPKYRKQIEENSEKARELKAQARDDS